MDKKLVTAEMLEINRWGSAIGMSRMNPQEDMGFHRHSFTEMVLVLEGKGIHRTQYLDYPISSCDVFVIPRGHAHAYLHCKGLAIINLMFSEELLELGQTDIVALSGYHALFKIEPTIQSSEKCRHLKMEGRKWQKLLAKVNVLEEELEERKPGSELYVKALLLELIIEISRSYPGEQISLNDSTDGLARALTHIEEQLHRKISTPELAEVSGISVSSLQRHFLLSTGLTPAAYINERRIERAEVLLKKTDRSVTNIAFDVGFSDSNYFSAVFQRLRGCSPKSLR